MRPIKQSAALSANFSAAAVDIPVADDLLQQVARKRPFQDAGLAQHQIVIVGAGLVGLVSALSLAEAGFDVALVERQLPRRMAEVGWPSRVVALNPSSQQLLARLGVWDTIEQTCQQFSAFERVEVYDPAAASEFSLDAALLGGTELGWIVPNASLLDVLWQRVLKAHAASQLTLYPQLIPSSWRPGVEFGLRRPGMPKPSGLVGCELQLQAVGDGVVAAGAASSLQQPCSGLTLQAELAIAADGARSSLRSLAAVKWQAKSYRQRALVAVVRHQHAHQKIARQSFCGKQILAFLPLADAYHSSIVWSVPEHEVASLMALDGDACGMRLTNMMEGQLGVCTVQTALKSFALSAQRASSYVQPYLALVGDAAHVIHPLAGQGVNLGFADVQALEQQLLAAQAAARPLHAWRHLRAYHRQRYPANSDMSHLMGMLKSCFASDDWLMLQLRARGLQGLQSSQCLQRGVFAFVGL